MITLLLLIFVFAIVFGVLGFCLRLTGGVLKLTCRLGSGFLLHTDLDSAGNCMF